MKEKQTRPFNYFARGVLEPDFSCLYSTWALLPSGLEKAKQCPE